MLCPTKPYGGTPVAIFQDGGLRRATTPHVGCGKSQNSKLGYVLPGAFAPHFGEVLHIASQKLGSVLQCFTGAFAPHFGGAQILHPPFLNFGPGGIAPGWAQVDPLLLHRQKKLRINVLN